MKKYITSAALIFSTAFAFGQKATDDFSGKWKTEKDKVVVFSKTEKGFTAVGEAKKEIVIEELQFTNGKWIGSVHTPKRGTMPCELLLNNGLLDVKVKVGRFSKTLHWTKA